MFVLNLGGHAKILEFAEGRGEKLSLLEQRPDRTRFLRHQSKVTTSKWIKNKTLAFKIPASQKNSGFLDGGGEENEEGGAVRLSAVSFRREKKKMTTKNDVPGGGHCAAENL